MPALIVELDPLPIVLALYASDVLAVTFLAKALRSTRGAGAADVLRSASVRGAADADPSGGYGGRLRLLAEADRANSPPIISREAPRHTAGADALAVGLHRGRGTVDPVVSAWYPPHLSSDRPTSPRGARCSLARCRVVAGTVDLRAQLHQVHVPSQSRTSRRRSPATWRPIDLAAYRRDGFAVGAREFHDGVHGFAAGVTDRAGAGVAALSLTGLGTRLFRVARLEIGTGVRVAAPEVSRNLTTGACSASVTTHNLGR